MAYASDSGHFYLPDGSPFYTIVARNGEERSATLRDARKAGAYPSVTTVLKCAHRPALERWKIQQAILSALTLPRNPLETDDEYCARVMDDSRQQAIKAAEEGTALHGAIEKRLCGQTWDSRWQAHIIALFEALLDKGIDINDGFPERSFSHPLGYGCRVDWYGQSIVMDFKSKPLIDTAKKLAYDEHLMQLTANGDAITRSGHRIDRYINVFIGIQDAKILIHEWTDKDEIHRAKRSFYSLLEFYKAQNNYFCGRPDI